jgi:hypothetical protein
VLLPSCDAARLAALAGAHIVKARNFAACLPPGQPSIADVTMCGAGMTTSLEPWTATLA